jgi:hypothetical protein
MNTSIRKVSGYLTALALMAAAFSAAGAATPLNGQLVLSPVSSHEVSSYGLPSNTELSGGIGTVGVGTAVYLEAEVNISVTDVTSVAWSVTNFVQPLYSFSPPPIGWNQSNLVSMLVTNPASIPLGTNVPVYEPASALVSKVAARALLRPTFDGQYTVTATITTAHEGKTNVSQVITAAIYMGDQICASCHNNNQITTIDTFSPWSQTLHAQIFSNEIDADGPYFAGESFISQSCFQCHTTGYDSNTNALVDGGFYSLEQKYGWTIPTVLTNGNFASMQAHYPYVAGMANVQCESCHGPGSVHAFMFGNTNNPSWPGVAVDEGAVGDCNQCHDDATHHPYGTEWMNSGHAVAIAESGSTSCVGCHTSYGFIARVEGITNGISTMTNYLTITTNDNLSYASINCQTCHEPHGSTVPTNNPHMIRILENVTLRDGTVVTNAGEGALCMECHQSRQLATAQASTYSSHFGPTMGQQADMLEGVNGFTYGQVIASSDHASISNTCVACHMQIIPSTDPAFLYAGSHTFSMSWAGTATNAAEDMVGACQQCHGPTLTSFDFPVENFDGYATKQGVQSQVQNLMNQVAMLLPGGEANVIAGNVTPQPNWTAPQLEAAYNYIFVKSDGSMGVHNTAYTVGLLQASIANLTGSSTPGGLPDAWVNQYFGSITNPAAAPNAINNTNGVPNWMMYALGLSPTQSGMSVPGGVVWVDDSSLLNSGTTNSIHIYRAAEISFNTQIGSSYQIQGIAQLSGGWSNIGSPIAGTGSAISYLTSTRNNPNMFFRVVTNP